MKRFFRANAVVCCLALIAGLMLSIGINAGETSKKVRVIFTNDTLGYLEPCG